MLQNARITGFTVSELLRENQKGGVELPPAQPPRLGLKHVVHYVPYSAVCWQVDNHLFLIDCHFYKQV